MIRMQIQLDETTYTLAKQRACAESKSLAEVVRDALDQYLTPSANQSAGLKGFTFIGSGQSSPGTPQPLSERHDEALGHEMHELATIGDSEDEYRAIALRPSIRFRDTVDRENGRDSPQLKDT